MKFIIKGSEEPEQVVTLELRNTGTSVTLIASDEHYEQLLMTFQSGCYSLVGLGSRTSERMGLRVSASGTLEHL